MVRSIDDLKSEAAQVDPDRDAISESESVPCRSGDRPARLGNGAVELVDYKTGTPQDQKKADRSLQLSLYALAARRELKLDPQRLTFYNLTSNEAVSAIRTDKDLEKAQETLREVAGEIRQRHFDPKPGYACKFCDYFSICPAQERNP